MSAAALFVLFALLAVVAPLVLYSLVRSEAEDTDRMSRDEARQRVSREQDDDRR
ncbi:hypothetical protein [Halobacterium sp. KA-6]|uniref:hypothetical protein n=1 Tax=Halobacterium sp. KA-6 TaxID=2896368 RepID=UPI001E5A158A|nr:hypothetical protein [Halobacterium sp. KA-6]MCD2204641.1 hypothetical protein [Halobacterium sp. KA-6]